MCCAASALCWDGSALSWGGAQVAATISGPASAAGAAPTKAPTTAPTKPQTVPPAELATAVRVAALPLARQTGTTLGRPSCPTGLRRVADQRGQCVVGFDAVLVPFLVTVAPDLTVHASPTFPVFATSEFERQAALLLHASRVVCGTGRVTSQPIGSDIECAAATAKRGTASAFTIGPDGRLTRRLADAKH